MLFNSLQFLFFFVIIIMLYFSTPQRFRWMLLLVASYYFYMCWKPEYIILIITSTVIDYYCGIMMAKHKSKRKKKGFLLLSLVANLGLLFAFKYFNFFNDSARAVFEHFNMFYNVPTFKLLLPVGISFYTFQTLSYSIDVYRGVKTPEKHFGIFALYVSFFPQLVAGPIERSTHLMHQFHRKHEFDYDRFVSGFRLILWGLVKKIVVADRLAFYVNAVYSNVDKHNATTLLLATYFFAFQIYCDFSGYSDIAIGCARILGFDLMQNFKRPYFSKSISEFWSRWHISLSTWFRDYLYITLGGNRVKKVRWYFNLFIVFLISGLWHGANWTFVIWGAIHGFYLVFSIWTKSIRAKTISFFNCTPKINNWFKVMITFHLVLFSWIFFRANNLHDAMLVVHKITTLQFGKVFLGGFRHIFYGFLALGILLSVEYVSRRFTIEDFICRQKLVYRWAFYIFCTIILLLIGVFDASQFIYFQF